MNTTHTFRCRPFNMGTDYAMLQGWWAGHGVLDVPPGYLPACGLVVELDGEAAAAAWIYFDNSCPLAWLAWLTTRPGMRPRDSLDALTFLLGAAQAAAEAQNRKVMFAEAPTKSLERFYQAHGFVVNHPTVHLFKGIG